MKKIIAMIMSLTAISAYSGPALAANAVPYSNIGLASATVDAKSGELIAGKSQNTVLPLASLTKLMTAIILIDLKIDFDKPVTVTAAEEDYTLPYIAKGDITSKIDLRAGDQVTKDDLWHAMLIASSNEAVIALADNSGVSRKEFVKLMNAKAKEFGLKNTKFTEPSGIDVKNVSTAKEMALIARKAYAHPSIRSASADPAYKFKEIATGRSISVYSRNTSLLAMKPLGMKVGYLTEAKNNCAVRLANKKKDRIVVILHAANSYRRNNEIARLMAK